jgi:chromosome segregation ATPase
VEIPLAERGRTDVITPFRWQLASLHLVPEDVVEYYVEATDNDRVSGPKSGESERFTLRLPSLDEVLADVHHDTERGRAELEETLRAAEEAARQSEELRRELRKDDRTTSWENRRKAEELARAYQEMQKSVEQSRNALQQALQHMEQNKLLSPETLEKYQELQQVLQDLASPEFAEAMKRLQQTMGQMNPEAMRQALQNFSFSEENFRKGLERTLNLLKRIQIEQKVDETLRRVEEMQNRLAELEKRTISPEAREQEARAAIERQQEDVRKKLGDLDRELSSLQARMEEFPGDMPLADMERARKEFGADSAAQRLQEAGERLERQDIAGAQEKQQEASQSLGRLEKSLAGMQQTLRKNQQRQVVNAMRRVVQDLLELSRRQEELKNSSRLLEPGSPQFRTNAQQQMENLRDLSNVTEQLSAVAQKSFGVTPEMGRALGEALKNMSESLQGLEARNGAVASERQSGAMSALNDAARLVQESLNAMMQGGGQGGGMAGFLQRLQGMSGMQQGINQGTQGLQQMSQQQAAAMARLAAEQAMVRKSLDQLSREASRQGDLSRMLGDLNTLAREMQEVQTDLARGSVTNETMRKQERILSRLLDSQRSARERDFEQQRRAETGRSTARSLPPQSDPSSLEGTSRLRRDLLRALEEGYAPDYQELIRKYYEALERQRTGTTP